jgi:pimeloyl-ACP methyl ester carboxylesterase
MMAFTISLFEILAATSVAIIALTGISYLIEALRTAPNPPKTLTWAPKIPAQYVKVSDTRLRYIKAGSGQNLVLLHTLRTQLDLFEKVVPDLAKSFAVYALDYPGHGYSDIPPGRYDADFFAGSVEEFLHALNLDDVTLCGVSIGGSIALILAGRNNPRVTGVVAINPYDYAKGRGMTRSSLLGWMITTTSRVPVLGETIMRLRNFAIMKAVLRGGVANAESIPPALLEEMYRVGNRRGHYRGFVRLLRNAASWETATNVYRNIVVPVFLIWGDKDWSNSSERERDRELIPGAQVATIEDGGHFLPLDRPRELQELIIRFASRRVQPA